MEKGGETLDRFRSKKYAYDIATVKKFGNNKFKLTLHRIIRVAGVEDDEEKKPDRNINKNKLAENISRARSKIFEYAYCNDWQYFVNCIQIYIIPCTWW